MMVYYVELGTVNRLCSGLVGLFSPCMKPDTCIEVAVDRGASPAYCCLSHSNKYKCIAYKLCICKRCTCRPKIFLLLSLLTPLAMLIIMQNIFISLFHVRFLPAKL